MEALICHALLKLMGCLSLSEQLLRRCELGRKEKRGEGGGGEERGELQSGCKISK